MPATTDNVNLRGRRLSRTFQSVSRFRKRSSTSRVEGHVPVPLPGLSIVRGKSLTPNGLISNSLIPSELDDDLVSFKNISCVEVADVAVERAYLRNIQHDQIAVSPIDAPEFCLRVEETQRHSLEQHAVKFSSKVVNIPKTIEDLPARSEGFEFGPLL